MDLFYLYCLLKTTCDYEPHCVGEQFYSRKKIEVTPLWIILYELFTKDYLLPVTILGLCHYGFTLY